MECGQRDCELQQATDVEDEEWRRGETESAWQLALQVPQLAAAAAREVIGPHLHQRRLPVHVPPLLLPQDQGQDPDPDLLALAHPGLQRAHLP